MDDDANDNPLAGVFNNNSSGEDGQEVVENGGSEEKDLDKSKQVNQYGYTIQKQ